MTTSARESLEAAIAKVEALDPAVRASIFTRFDAARIRREAEALDADPARRDGPLKGLLVSIKDLFDEAGEVTSAGSKLLAGDKEAQADAEVVRRLRAAGALPFGRTTMSEFAYSGVGLNPHHGDPGNARDASRISGGSTSGGALTVALGLADAALGSDTGGSVRIPAALNGLAAFKPTRTAVPLDGTYPLSPSYDSIGPIARDVETCARLHAVLSGEPQPTAPISGRRLGVVTDFFTDGMDETVGTAFAAAQEALRGAGFELVEATLEHVRDAGPANRTIVGTEALRQHAPNLERLAELGDPRVLARIRAAESFAEGEEAAARSKRLAAKAAFNEAATGYDAFITPTVPVVAPTIAEASADFDRINALMLRNPSVINFLDGCAASVPMGPREGLASGLMIFAPGGSDWTVLALAAEIEAALAARR